MLKISIVDSRAQRRLVLEGALIPPSLIDLRTAWLRASTGRQGRKIVLVFRNVTSISTEGEAALWDLMNRGVRFSSGGVLTKQVLQKLVKKSRPGESACIAHFDARPDGVTMTPYRHLRPSAFRPSADRRHIEAVTPISTRHNEGAGKQAS
jgi:hypothetical protein